MPTTRATLRVLLVVSAFAGALLLAYLVRRQLIWIFTGAFLALALNPAVDGIGRLLPNRGRGTAVGIVLLLVVVVLAVIGFTLIPPLVTQSQALVENFPGLLDRMEQSGTLGGWLQRLELADRLRAQEDRLLQDLSGATGSFVNIAGRVFGSVAAVVTILVLAVFMLLEGPTWLAMIARTQPAKRRLRYEPLIAQMYKALTGYVTGNLLTSLIATAATSITLTIVGVPYAIPLGIFVGLIDLLPLVGATLGAIVVCLVALFTSLWAAVIMGIFFLVYQQVENHLLQPIVYARTVQISPLLVLVSILLGAALAGIIGALAAIPIAASIQILVRDHYARARAPRRRPRRAAVSATGPPRLLRGRTRRRDGAGPQRPPA